MSEVKRVSDLSHARLLWGYLRPERALFLRVVTLSISTTVLAIAPPYLLQRGLELLERGGPTNDLIRWFALGCSALLAVEWLLRVLQKRAVAVLSNRAVARLREDVFNRVLSNGLSFFDGQRVGDRKSVV